MSQEEVHRIHVERSARYYTLGGSDALLDEIWFVLHGYAQLAQEFLQSFRGFEAPGRLFVAPEGLSRFYAKGGKEVVASWMTREDREAEIEDYVRFLDAVRREVTPAGTKARVGVLGFSQGAATACRWTALGSRGVDRLVLWAGEVPPDLGLAAHAGRLDSARPTLVWGERDPFVTHGRLTEETACLERHRITHDLVRFRGGHELDTSVLRRVLDGSR